MVTLSPTERTIHGSRCEPEMMMNAQFPDSIHIIPPRCGLSCEQANLHVLYHPSWSRLGAVIKYRHLLILAPWLHVIRASFSGTRKRSRNSKRFLFRFLRVPSTKWRWIKCLYYRTVVLYSSAHFFHVHPFAYWQLTSEDLRRYIRWCNHQMQPRYPQEVCDIP